MLTKMPPIEKIPEAFSAIADHRIQLEKDIAYVTSSNHAKKYCIYWKDNIYFSNDSATFWQGYPGYPIIAVLMLQQKISYNEVTCERFKNIDWNAINLTFKRNYKEALEYVLLTVLSCSEHEYETILREINDIYLALKQLDITCQKGYKKEPTNL